MNVAERGAYMQLLILAWDDPHCSIPADERDLQALADWGKQWGSFKRVRACFAPHPTQAGRLYNARLYEEWKYCHDKSEAAKESARHRWQPESKPTPIQPTKDRQGKGFSSLGSSIAEIADKHFPPRS